MRCFQMSVIRGRYTGLVCFIVYMFTHFCILSEECNYYVIAYLS